VKIVNILYDLRCRKNITVENTCLARWRYDGRLNFSAATYIYICISFNRLAAILPRGEMAGLKNSILDVTGFLTGRLTTDPLNAFENNMGWPEIA